MLVKPLSFDEVLSLPLIILEPKSNSRSYVEKYMMTKGIKITPEIELGSHDLLGLCFLKSVPLSPDSTRFVEIIEEKEVVEL